MLDFSDSVRLYDMNLLFFILLYFIRNLRRQNETGLKQ